MSVSDFASFAADLTVDAIPDDAVARASHGVRDTVGTALAGSVTRSVTTARAAYADDHGAFLALLPGAPAHTPAAAAFLSALAASALDFDDGHYRGGAIHPSSVIVPTILVAASNRPTTHDHVLAAYVAAFETAVRLGHLLWPEDEARDRWYCTGTAAAVGAAVGAAKIRGGDADTIARAMRIAWAHAPIAALQWPMVKEAIGWSAATAMTACVLAEAGFMTGSLPGDMPLGPSQHPPSPLDDEATRNDPFVSSLGSTFEIENGYFKPYPACRFTHTAIDALLDLLASGVAAAEVASITVRTHRWATFLDYTRPMSLEYAQYSYPFVLGTVLARGRITPGEMSEDSLRNEAVLHFADRISVVHDPALDAHLPDHYATQIEVEMTGGRMLRLEPRLKARGDSTRPLGDDELREKFMICADLGLHDGGDALAEAFDRKPGTAELWELMKEDHA